METPPPLFRDQRKVDQDHLNLLTIFHFIMAGLSLVGIAFLFAHYQLMGTIMNNPQMFEGKPSQPPFQPQQFFAMFRWLYLFMGSLMILGGIGNLLSGLYLRARKNRMFSLIVAGLNCLNFPFGTALGVFTFVVLLRDSVVELYDFRSAT